MVDWFPGLLLIWGYAMRIAIVTLGTRGDVQPYVALGLGLQSAGHNVRLAASDDFCSLVEDAGLPFWSLGENFMAYAQAKGQQAMMESSRANLLLINEVVGDVWQMMQDAFERMLAVCQDVDAIVGSLAPGALTYHIAEKLNIPHFYSFTIPFFLRTRTMPNPVFPAMPERLRPLYPLTHHFLEHFAWQPIRVGVNRIRRDYLDLPPLGWRFPYYELSGDHVPYLYCFSPAVVPLPPDARPGTHFCGYWFLPHADDWTPPVDLMDFISAGPPPVYVGFGSMVNRNPAEATAIVVEALQRAGQRGVLAAGWGGLKQSDLPEDILLVESCPHDWLFPRMAAVVHHGGAGTTGAGLRAGVPTIIVPFMGDQPFWGRRVADLDVGPEPIPRKRLTAERLSYAIRVAVEHGPMRERAAVLGEKIRAEDGVSAAVAIIERALAQ